MRGARDCAVEVYPEFAEGLQDVEGFSHLILLYVFHQSSGYALRTKPFLDDTLRGLFATRHPCRPNSIGMCLTLTRQRTCAPAGTRHAAKSDRRRTWPIEQGARAGMFHEAEQGMLTGVLRRAD